MVPIDGSEDSLEALKIFLKISNHKNNKIYLLNVQNFHLPQQDCLTLGDQKGLIEYHKKNAQEILQKGVELLGEMNYEKIIRMGETVTEIINFSEEIDADLIVMGSHGRTGLSAVLLGSVSQKVLSYSKHPVMITRPSQEEPEDYKKKHLGFKVE